MADPTCVHSLARRLAALTLIALLATLLIPVTPMRAASMTQDDPAEQCARGVELFEAGELNEALPFLQAGFSKRDQAKFYSTNDLGWCALALGMLWERTGSLEDARIAYEIALTTFRQGGEQLGEGLVLNNLGLMYHNRQFYNEALNYYLQSMVLQREIGDQSSLGVTYVNIGGIYNDQSSYKEALNYYFQGLSILEALNKKQHMSVALRNIGEVYFTQGNTEEALDYFRKALRIQQEIGSVSLQSDTNISIASVLFAQGDISEALNLFQKALKIKRETGDLEGQSSVLNNIGNSHSIQQRFDDALDAYNQALKIWRSIGDRDGEATTLNNIGGVYRSRGQFTDANAIYTDALDIYKEINDRAGVALTLNNLGEVYGYQGRHLEALNLYQQALKMAEEMGLRRQKSTILNNIAVIYAAQARLDDALVIYLRALAIHREIGARASESATLNNIGGIYHQQEKFPEALVNYQQSLLIARGIGDLASEARILSNIGLVYDSKGDHVNALFHIQQALNIFNEIGGGPGMGAAYTNLGNIFQSEKRYEEALTSYKQALEAQTTLGERVDEIFTLAMIGDVYDKQNIPTLALEYFSQSLDALEDVRPQMGNEQSKISFISRYAPIYTLTVGLYHRQGRDTQAFFTAERGRARAFLDSLATGTVEISDAEAQTLLEQEREAYASRQAVQDALIRVKAQSESDVALISDLEAQLQQAEAAYAEVQAQIASRGDQLESLVSARKDAVLSLEDVQASLDADTTLVSYVVGENDGLAFVVTGDSLHTVDLTVRRDTLIEQMAGLHQFNTVTETTTLSGKFYSQLIAPLQLDPARSRLLIIPHGVLHYLPFAALTPDGKRFLGDDYTISLLPAASVLPYVQEPITATATLPGVVALANPNGSSKVEGVEEAARTIGQLFGVEPLLGAQATVANLQVADDGTRVLHIGAHGSFNLAAPLDSYLQLTPAGANDDGELTVGEVYGLNLKQADLVVLSACETQVNQLSNPKSPLAVTAGDELVGMQRAFFFAGAQNVVTTLWKVPDAPSQLMMERFYTHIRDGLAPADALQRAQQEVRAQYPNPRDWAGFVISGVGATPLVEPPPWWQQVPWWGWALGAIIALSLVGGGALWWRGRTGRSAGGENARDATAGAAEQTPPAPAPASEPDFQPDASWQSQPVRRPGAPPGAPKGGGGDPPDSPRAPAADGSS